MGITTTDSPRNSRDRMEWRILREWIPATSNSCLRIYDNRQKSGDYISKYALDYMRHKATACIGIRFLRYVTLTVTAGLYDRNGNYIAADGRQTPYRTYALLDARIAWERRHLRIYIDGNNITATRYCDFGGLKMPEGWFTGGLVVTY